MAQHKIIVFSILLGLFLWTADAAIGAYLFHEGTFFDLLIARIPSHDLIMRAFILVSFIMFGTILARILDEYKRTEEMLRESKTKYRTVADFTYDWESWIDPEGRFLYVSPSCERITGYRPEEFLEHSDLLVRIVHPADRSRIAEHLRQDLERRDIFHIDFRIITRGGEERWISHYCQPLCNGLGRLIGRRASNRDITDRKRLESELEKLATTDKLTGLYNRSKLEEYLEHEIKESRRLGHPLSLAMFDIDRFKTVNDTYGHDVGDFVLTALAEIAKEHLRGTDILGRWGGEEFIALMPGADSRGAGVSAEKLRKKIEIYEFENAGRITVSFGIAQLNDADTGASFVKRADDALYQAKRNGRNRVELA